ncbi:hypothetical protein HAZT_HAZT001213 [Hyalella azteca]|uniref:Reverse transcriptase domain-containing protein n=1 Tax=Hyalella azteca TaxID=294128 RepID=A0A6A0H081_HYAAZ|nr:hypothetical protein HAZT_HAZT001213 [Hyalella azteca]
MNMMLDAGFMERVPEEELHVHTGGLWYLSHHGVYHKEKDNELSNETVEYRLTVHVFGAVSSPTVANFALRKVSEDHDMSDQCKAAMNENFYVDDLLLSTNDASEAEILLRQMWETSREKRLY